MTLEEAQARILELEDQLTERTAERDSLLQDKDTLSADLGKARELNSRLLDKIPAHFTPAPVEPDEPEAPTCEDFAKSIIL